MPSRTTKWQEGEFDAQWGVLTTHVRAFRRTAVIGSHPAKDQPYCEVTERGGACGSAEVRAVSGGEQDGVAEHDRECFGGLVCA
ncbi:MAG: hypothetical protein ACRDNW_22990, partial [Trebonia sp.]